MKYLKSFYIFLLINGQDNRVTDVTSIIILIDRIISIHAQITLELMINYYNMYILYFINIYHLARRLNIFTDFDGHCRYLKIINIVFYSNLFVHQYF